MVMRLVVEAQENARSGIHVRCTGTRGRQTGACWSGIILLSTTASRWHAILKVMIHWN
jgi:hypothetical protein